MSNSTKTPQNFPDQPSATPEPNRLQQLQKQKIELEKKLEQARQELNREQQEVEGYTQQIEQEMKKSEEQLKPLKQMMEQAQAQAQAQEQALELELNQGSSWAFLRNWKLRKEQKQQQKQVLEATNAIKNTEKLEKEFVEKGQELALEFKLGLQKKLEQVQNLEQDLAQLEREIAQINPGTIVVSLNHSENAQDGHFPQQWSLGDSTDSNTSTNDKPSCDFNEALVSTVLGLVGLTWWMFSGGSGPDLP